MPGLLTKKRWRVISTLFLLMLLLGGLRWGLNQQRPAPTNAAQQTSAPLEFRGVFETRDEDVLLTFVTADGSPLPAELRVRATFMTPAGPLVRETVTNGFQTHVSMPFVRAGTVPYRLEVGSSVQEGAFVRAAGEPVTPLQLNIGARAARVTGGHDPALVVHPLDAQHNVTDLPVLFQAFYPDGAYWERTVSVEHLMAWTFVPTGTSTGTLGITATSHNARGERGEVDLLPGISANATYGSNKTAVLASGRDTWQLNVKDTQDTLNNIVSDGTSAVFYGGNDTLDLYVTRSIIQGDQPLVLPSPPQQGTYSVRVNSGDYLSQPLELLGLPVVKSERFAVQWVSASPLSLRAGPFFSDNNALVDSGTLVRLSVFSVDDALLLSFSAPVEDGVLITNLPPLPAGSDYVLVDIAGQQQQLDVRWIHAFQADTTDVTP